MTHFKKYSLLNDFWKVKKGEKEFRRKKKKKERFYLGILLMIDMCVSSRFILDGIPSKE